MTGATRSELVELQQTLYTSRNPTRRWLHNSRRRWIEAALRRAAGPECERALEVGPGSGIYLPVLAELATTVVASDVEEDFLETARELGERHPGIEPVTDDITATSLPDASFDLILCSEVIEHVRESPAALQGMRRLLRPGGRLVLSTPQRFSPLELAARVATLPGVVWLTRLVYREAIQPLGHINLLTARAAEAQLRDAGFTIEERHLSGVYLPLVAEIGGAAALRLEQWLEPRMRRGRLSGLLWTQYYVARA